MNEALFAGSDPAPSCFRAGFAAVDISPRESVPMDGCARSILPGSTWLFPGLSMPNSRKKDFTSPGLYGTVKKNIFGGKKMKRIIYSFLAAVLILGLVACGSGAAPAKSTQGTGSPAQSQGFQAGFAAVNVTPQESVPMDGYSSSAERMSTGFLSYLYVMAVAATDSQGNTAVLISLDSCTLDEAFTNEIRAWVQETYGIPKENVILSAIHQHSCVDLDSTVPSAQQYRKEMIAGTQQCVTEALADRAPAELYINTAQTEAMNFVRHYWTNAGTMYGDNYGSSASGLASHESDADPEMRMVKFVREGDKKDILLVNFQVHPHMGGGGQSATNLHSDWPGVMRDTVAKELGVHCLYFSGAGGNLNSTSLITAENVSKDYKDHGARAAQYVIGAEGSYEKVSGEGIQGMDMTGTYDVDHSQDHLLPGATAINNARSVSSADAKALLKQYPEFNSIFHATAVVSKADLPATREVTVTMVAIGDVLFTGHPYEMFDTNGMELRQGTVGNPNYAAEEQLENPFKMTVIATKANGNHGYIPSQLNYTNGGYSVDVTKFAAGTSERIVGDLLAAAQKLHK